MKKNIIRLALVYLISLIAVGTFWFFFHRTELQIFPLEEKTQTSVYSDIKEGGSSTARILRQDSILNFEVELHSGTEHPFAGVLLPLSKQKETFTKAKNFSGFDSVAILFRSPTPKISLILFARDPKAAQIGDIFSLRPQTLSIEASPAYKETRIALSELETPLLWFDKHKIQEDRDLYLDEISFIGIESAKGTLLGIPAEIEIKGIRFFGKNRAVDFGSLLALLIFTGAFVLGLRRFYDQNAH
ncbi:MAG: hypothetical protein M0P13_00300 [Fibrobacteraceae bacterium]|nr:hypothetical protein [Fibrobacteraceae bacterium]